MNSLDIAAELSDFYAATGCEGTVMAEMFDSELLPLLKMPLVEGGIGLGDRFAKAIERVRASLGHQDRDRVRTLKDMMKSALVTYVRNTHDAMTAREMFHRAVMSGSDTMLTVTAAVILANALHGQHANEAKTLVQQVAGRLSGEQARIPALENASGGATGAGAIAVAATGKKKKNQLIRRQPSIFCSEIALDWRDIQDLPANIDLLAEIADCGCPKRVDGVVVDPTTAELVMSVHKSIPPKNRFRYASKSLGEMIEIAHRCVQRGLIQVVMEEG